MSGEQVRKFTAKDVLRIATKTANKRSTAEFHWGVWFSASHGLVTAQIQATLGDEVAESSTCVMRNNADIISTELELCDVGKKDFLEGMMEMAKAVLKFTRGTDWKFDE